IDDALAHVFVPGRFQVFQKHCPVILDVAHNPQSAGLLAENLKAQSLQGKTYAVFSALADKDIEAMLKPMLDVIDYWYISVINTARAADRLQLTESLAGCDHAYYASLEQAYQSALSKATAKDRIVVFGSFYVVAAILPIVQGITCENS
ncbi:MAG: hypothetical protein K0S29_1422, partial [Gammaproteobacteria bacterium]|nr:hypothetical protein [Gammaproteobacteria bacterium]